MLKKILSYGVCILLPVAFSGCAYDSASLEYAKKNKLSEELYSDVKIECVTTHDISEDKDYIFDIISEKMVEESGKKCISTYEDNKNGPYSRMAVQKLRACVGLVGATDVISLFAEGKSGAKLFNIDKKNMYEGKNLGVWGYEEVNNDNILFYHNSSGTAIVGKAISSYVKNKNLTCKNKTDEIAQAKIDAKNNKETIDALNKMTFADNLNGKLQLGLVYYNNAPGATLDGYTYDPTYIFGVKVGLLNMVGPLGMYLELSMPITKEEEYGRVDPYLQYQQYGLGMNYTLVNSLSLFTGIGISQSTAAHTISYNNIKESTGDTTLYTTVGMTYLFDTFFYADISYQSVGGVGFGLGYKFGK